MIINDEWADFDQAEIEAQRRQFEEECEAELAAATCDHGVNMLDHCDECAVIPYENEREPDVDGWF